MAVSRKVERDRLRNEYILKIYNLFLLEGEDVDFAKSNEINVPVVGCEGNEDWVIVTVKVPTGANKGTEPYDGYEMREEYKMKLKEKAEKAKATAEKKARKIARDKANREKKEG